MTTLPADEAMKKAIQAGTIAADEYWIGEKLGDSQEGADMAFLRAAIRALDAVGWQCVPKVATEEMFFAPDDVCVNFGESPSAAFSRIYRDLLAAAPKLFEVKR